VNINMAASTDPSSSPTNDWSDYFKRFRVEAVAAENTWGPNNGRVVSMFRSKLYVTNVSVTPAASAGRIPTGTVSRSGAILPSWGEYGSDLCWSQDGSLFACTSFDQADTGNQYNPDGLNGDMKRRGKIAIASADMTG